MRPMESTHFTYTRLAPRPSSHFSCFSTSISTSTGLFSNRPGKAPAGPQPSRGPEFAHDHLYSPVALLQSGSTGAVLERYEYDAYGNFYVLEPNFADDPDGKSDYGNPYLFTGRRVDILDNGSLTIQYNRNRYYDYYTGRWTTHDPLGIDPAGSETNPFGVTTQYRNGMNLYEYAYSYPLLALDPYGSFSLKLGFLVWWPKLRGIWETIKAVRAIGLCDEKCTDSEPTVLPLPDPIPDSWKYGYTSGMATPMFTVRTSLCSFGCSGGCRRLCIDTCSCTYSWWYYKVTARDRRRLKRAGFKFTDDKGRWPEQHEKEHVRKIKEECWRDLVKAVHEIVWGEHNQCMCPRKAECYQEVIDLRVQAETHRCDRRNYYFDWKHYRGYRATKWAKDMYDRADKLWRDFTKQANRKKLECDAM